MMTKKSNIQKRIIHPTSLKHVISINTFPFHFLCTLTFLWIYHLTDTLTTATQTASKHNGFISWLFESSEFCNLYFINNLTLKKKVNFEIPKILEKDIACDLSTPRGKVKHLQSVIQTTLVLIHYINQLCDPNAEINFSVPSFHISKLREFE